MNDFDPKVIEKFDPNIADLTSMVEATTGITATDLEDPKQLSVVKEHRISLKKARVQIEKAGLAARDEAKAIALRKDRLEKLPMRKERISKAGLESFATKSDDQLLDLDANQFEAYFNELGATKVRHDADKEEASRQEADRLLAEENARIKAEQESKAAEIAAAQKKLDDERMRLEHEKEVEQARKDTEARMKKEQEEREADAEKKRIEDEKRAAAERKEAEAKLKKNKEYQAFLKDIGMTKENAGDFHKVETDSEIIVFKKVGSFKKS